jgi:mannose-6-phosphate isomerase-like protein (cupin superfamily)
MDDSPPDAERRRLVALAAGLALAPGVAALAQTHADWTRLRRVVTAEGLDGRGVVLADGEPGNSFVMNGTRIMRLWETPAVPARLPVVEHLGATAGSAYRAGFRGASFYVAEIPPGTDESDIPLHRQDTLDFMAVLAGRIVLRLEDRELELGAGDTLVQAGNLHTWINRFDAPCLLLFVVLAAEHERQAAAKPAALAVG